MTGLKIWIIPLEEDEGGKEVATSLLQISMENVINSFLLMSLEDDMDISDQQIKTCGYCYGIVIAEFTGYMPGT